ncbi:MAG TPA: HipA family kinase [Thermoanaerobaculia bacterium]|nr:HipA family kinase [Thermoanaerobaculia bacterium]
MLPLVNATAFQREFSSGTTKPCLLLCESKSGEREEYVTKFRSTVRNQESGLCFECFAAALAQRLGIPMPETAIVSINPGLAEAIRVHNPSVGARMLASAGLNFGSRFLASHATWPTDRIVPASARQVATDIMAFDALIENVDRRSANPNVLALGDDLRAFDHELAFGFIYELFSERPWIDRLAFLTQHVFYTSLRNRELDLSRFLEALRSLTDSDLEEICRGIPSEFGVSYLGRICDHIRKASAQADVFSSALRAVLR